MSSVVKIHAIWLQYIYIGVYVWNSAHTFVDLKSFLFYSLKKKQTNKLPNRGTHEHTQNAEIVWHKITKWNYMYA